MTAIEYANNKDEIEEQEPKESINLMVRFYDLIKTNEKLAEEYSDVKDTILNCIDINSFNPQKFHILAVKNLATNLVKEYNNQIKSEYKELHIYEEQFSVLEINLVGAMIDDLIAGNILEDEYKKYQANTTFEFVKSKISNFNEIRRQIECNELDYKELERPKAVEQEKEQTETETSFKDLSAFTITWKTKHEFEQVLKSANTLNDEITFTVDGDGLHYRSMDASHVALIDVFLAKTSFEEFNNPETLTKFGLRIDETLKILQQIENNESLEIKLNEKNFTLEISNKEGFKSKQRLIESSEQNCPLPKLNFNTEITLTEKAINILKKRSQLGEYFTIETKNNEYVNFIARNDMGEFEQKFDCLSQVVAELKTKEDSVATYSVDYMMKFLKSFTSIKPKEFKFEYSSKMPLRIEVPQINGRMHFYLAPRI